MAQSEIGLLSVGRTRDLSAVVIPVHFAPSVPEGQVREILESLLGEAAVYCRPEHLLTVVDRGTAAERVLAGFPGLRIHRLERNKGKAGAVAAGLSDLLATSDARYLVTRDCDGDHAQEDLPRLISLAAFVEGVTGCPVVSVMGARPSLEKPMGWLRDQWERLTNSVLLDALDYALARQGRVLDRRFWSGAAPDIQSGYRVYSRPAAARTAESLESLPDDPDVWTFACEFVPFADLVMAGGVFAQLQRLTQVEQPVTSYGGVDLPRVYGRLLAFVGDRLEIPREILRQCFDNHLIGTSLFFTDSRGALLEARDLIDPGAPEVQRARLL
ncbi:MAG: glycosyltransferase [Acidobacteriota bacterium]